MEYDKNDLIEAANDVRNKAYAPYSNFKVGAALLAKSGKIYAGCNVENLSYGATACAERNAVAAAIAGGDKDFEAICITSGEKETLPCGICRQVLNEFSPDITVICSHKEGITEYSLKDLLPHSFNK